MDDLAHLELFGLFANLLQGLEGRLIVKHCVHRLHFLGLRLGRCRGRRTISQTKT